MSSARPGPLILLLSALLGLQPVTTDLFLPALPEVRHTLDATMAQIQLTMSLVMLCFGIGQLLVGRLADRFGRAAVLRLGMVLYAAASIAAATTPHMEGLVAARALQGFGLAAAVVCARALVRDHFAPELGPHVMSRALSGLGLMALISPVVGGWIASHWGWRGTMSGLLAYACAVLLLVWRHVPAGATIPSGPGATALLPTLRRIICHRQFLSWSGLSAATYGGLFVFLSASAFVSIEILRIPLTTYGWLMAACSLSYLAATALCRRLLPRFGPIGTVRIGAGFTLSGGAGMAALMLWPPDSAWVVFVPQALYVFGHGLHQPCAQAGAVSPFPEAAGTAAALSGFLQALAAFLSGLWLGRTLADGGADALAAGMTFWAVITAVMALLVVPRSRGL